MEKLNHNTIEYIDGVVKKKINELVDAVNEQLTTNETFNKTAEELNIKLHQHWDQQKEIIDSLDALRNSPFGDAFREWFKSRLTTTSDTIDRLTKENEELKAKLLKVSEYAKQKRIALNCHLTCVMRPEEILHMIGEKV